MYFVVDPDKEVAPQHAAFVWRRLWEMRDLAPIGALLPAVVSSPCALLPSEDANASLVASLTQVPEGTAWVSVHVDLVRFVSSRGVQEQRLAKALCDAVETGERRHDETRWFDAAQREDSRENRRLSVFVRGWGDVAALLGADPRQLATLRQLEALADFVVATLEQRSAEIGAQRGYCPVLDIAGARARQFGDEMNVRWQQAVAANGLRHRNLLTLSPWDVFPRHGPADFRYMNLLPIVRKAHSVSLRRDVDIAKWNARDFRAFHERVSAILRRASELPGVAQLLETGGQDA